MFVYFFVFFFFSSRRRHTRWTGDWSSRRVLFRSYQCAFAALRLRDRGRQTGTVPRRDHGDDGAPQRADRHGLLPERRALELSSRTAHRRKEVASSRPLAPGESTDGDQSTPTDRRPSVTDAPRPYAGASARFTQ